MIVQGLFKGEWKDSGTVRLEDGKVVLSGDLNSFKEIFWVDKNVTPEDGMKYLEALVGKFSRSYGVRLIKEPQDTWLEKFQINS
jgi:hypothetical protein